MLNSRYTTVILESPKEWQLGFQDGATSIMEGIVDLHSDVFFVMLTIGFLVIFMVAVSIFKFNSNKRSNFNDVKHHTLLEVIWTIVPALILILLAIPSFALLFQTDEYKDPFMVVQISGNQWYWSYSITTTLCKMSFDSYMSVFEGSQEYKGFKRLLEITNALYVPHDLAIRVLITSNDVLHCWAIPALGIKVDAVPGRLNQTFIETTKEGTFYGQCSEICGVNHGFMPIKVVSIRI